MDIVRRYNSVDRKQYSSKDKNVFKIKPRLLHVGEMKKSPGRRESNHAHDFCEIVFIPRGKGIITIDGTPHEVIPGDIIINNPLVTHFEESASDCPMELLFMAFDRFELAGLEKNCLLPQGYELVYRSGRYYEVILALFEQMIAELKSKDEFRCDIVQNLAQSLLMYILRIINEKREIPLALSEVNKTVDGAVSYVKENFNRNITLDDIAQNCFVNKYYLAHLFTKHQGISIGKYILNLRISEAMRLLRETDLSVSEISEKAGFSDISYFCRVFKKNVSLTPLQFRQHESERAFDKIGRKRKT